MIHALCDFLVELWIVAVIALLLLVLLALCEPKISEGVDRLRDRRRDRAAKREQKAYDRRFTQIVQHPSVRF